MAAAEVSDFVGENRRLSDFVESLRSVSESDKHWRHRRDFLFRNISHFREPEMDQLIALSMVWQNHVFLGCRYSESLLQRVELMAEGIEVEDAPVFQTRDQIMRQQKR